MNERTAVYRLFAADDSLLYVGISKTFGRRWHSHTASQHWWPDVHHQTIGWYPDRTTARRAETEAINAEGPRHNIRKRAPRPPGNSDRHRHKAITPRPPAELRERAQGAVTQKGTSINAIVIAFLRWYVRDTDDLPERPA